MGKIDEKRRVSRHLFCIYASFSFFPGFLLPTLSEEKLYSFSSEQKMLSKYSRIFESTSTYFPLQNLAGKILRFHGNFRRVVFEKPSRAFIRK